MNLPKKKKGFTAWFYREQAITDIGANQIGWFYSMADFVILFILLLNAAGVVEVSVWLFVFIYLGNMIALNLLGRLFLFKGWYKVDRYTFANIDPVEKKKLKAAEIIIKKEERRKK